MSLPKIVNLTETDVKILLAFVQKQTLEDMARVTAISYAYAQVRVRYLKKKGFIQSVGKDGQAFVYQPSRLPETDPLYSLRATSNGKAMYHLPYFYGASPTLAEAMGMIFSRKKM